MTIRAIAAAIMVAPESLHSRLNSSDDLFDLALDAALGQDARVAEAVASAPLEELMPACYRHLVEHPWAPQVIAMRAPRGPHYLQLSERMCTLLTKRGVEDPMREANWLTNFTIGSALGTATANTARFAAIDPVIAPVYAKLHGTNAVDAEDLYRRGLITLLSAGE
ncbi:TetR/AcrR family transcriptional regulator C-terminal domain-containing protein [Paramicrobacterium chengjingii]|uniref:TetR/AcrR family transcriptional regulator C-terminal domain-containing protein n=1 Tax=Paramicrobacterium chengjingii TaxID=2769067 RepID=UPI001421F1ED|nr:TetR/AcrR family transcriptional regulator C-terminal domain-containing protein [Microbacterium chengjingii]